MPLPQFKNICLLADMINIGIFIGGGEPTVHPDFDKLLTCALDLRQTATIYTNGKIMKHALRIAELSKEKKILGGLSLDKFHESISSEVIDGFKSICIKDTSTIAIAGNAKTLNENTIKQELGLSIYHECYCPGIFINPHGEIKTCGCDRGLLIGRIPDNVMTSEETDKIVAKIDKIAEIETYIFEEYGYFVPFCDFMKEYTDNLASDTAIEFKNGNLREEFEIFLKETIEGAHHAE